MTKYAPFSWRNLGKYFCSLLVHTSAIFLATGIPAQQPALSIPELPVTAPTPPAINMPAMPAVMPPLMPPVPAPGLGNIGAASGIEGVVLNLSADDLEFLADQVRSLNAMVADIDAARLRMHEPDSANPFTRQPHVTGFRMRDTLAVDLSTQCRLFFWNLVSVTGGLDVAPSRSRT